MATIARLFDFQPGDPILSGQVDGEFNQLVNLLNGTTLDKNVVIGGGLAVGLAVDPTAQVDVKSLDVAINALKLESASGATVALVTETLTADDTTTVAPFRVKTTNSSGTAAAGFGMSEAWQLESSTTPGINASIDKVFWRTATHATVSAVRVIQLTDQGVLADRVIYAPSRSIPDGSATTLFTIAIPTAGIVAGSVIIHVQSTNGTDHNVRQGMFNYAAVNKAGTVTAAENTIGNQVTIGSGGSTLTFTVAAVVVGATIEFRVTPNTSLDVALMASFTLFNHTLSAVTITP
jgi:hypothetical protein